MTALSGAVLGLATLLILSACGSLRPDARVGELVSFDALVNGESAEAEFLIVELADGVQPDDVFDHLGEGEITTLPSLEPDFRRFAFIDSGCAQDSAQLVISYDVEDGEESGTLDAQLLEDGSTEQQTDCAQAVYFLSVFDVSVRDLPDRLI